jgi:hypothetical protein
LTRPHSFSDRRPTSPFHDFGWLGLERQRAAPNRGLAKSVLGQRVGCCGDPIPR